MYDYSVLENPYYIDKKHQKNYPDATRRVNFFTIKSLFFLLCNSPEGTVDISSFKEIWKKKTLPDNVYYNEEGNDRKYVGFKLKIFLQILEKEENRNALLDSLFTKCIRRIASLTWWEDWAIKEECNDAYCNRNCLTGAFRAYRECAYDINNKKVDIGLNMDLLLDKILHKKENGEWIIKDSIGKDLKMVEQAIDKFVVTLQQNKEFQDNYYKMESLPSDETINEYTKEEKKELTSEIEEPSNTEHVIKIDIKKYDELLDNYAKLNDAWNKKVDDEIRKRGKMQIALIIAIFVLLIVAMIVTAVIVLIHRLG
ncbi:MAG: hypothetical protein K6F59_03050 [Gammaproteobacteria bacterium]|nr:hypothetical protein [Gammaproteobacteria bacterium]